MYKECLNCHNPLDAKKLHTHPNLKFCSSKCRCEHNNKIYYKDYLNIGLSTSTSGTLNELLVCIDLTRKGWEVFKAISPSCSCDLIIMKNLKKCRVEVRQGKELSKNISYIKTNKADYMAVLVKNDKVKYYNTSNFKEIEL